MQVALHPLVVCALVANAAAFALSAATGTTWSGVLAATVAKGAGLAQGSGTLLLSLLSVVILTFAFRIYSQRALLKRCAIAFTFSSATARIRVSSLGPPARAPSSRACLSSRRRET